MLESVISKPMYRVLTGLTQEPRLEVALPLAIKDWLRLKLVETRREREQFERRYGMTFEAFKQAWDADQVADRYSYEVERDYWEWEASVTDEARLLDMMENMP